MTDHDAFMQAILAATDDDAPRLIYADWLEEQGDEAKADFVRVQCELARLLEPHGGKWPHEAKEWCDCEHCTLRRRERELWLSVFPVVPAPFAALFSASDAPPVHHCLPAGIVRRGSVEVVHTTLAQWCGGEQCPQCRTGAFDHPWAKIDACASCHGTGTLPGIGPALVAAQPVQRVVTEKRPTQGTMRGYEWYKERGRRNWSEFHLPDEIFELLQGGECHRQRMQDGTEAVAIRWYPTEQAALNALECHALLRHARGVKPDPRRSESMHDEHPSWWTFWHGNSHRENQEEFARAANAYLEKVFPGFSDVAAWDNPPEGIRKATTDYTREVLDNTGDGVP